MNDLPIQGFLEAIQATHRAKAVLARREHLVATFRGETAWAGEVLVFKLLDHPSASWCYAWEVDGEVTAVLHEGPVDGPQAAVKAAIVTEPEG